MAQRTLSCDTETTGLRPWHEDRLFSIIISAGLSSYYFNFQAYPGLDAQAILLPYHLEKLTGLFDDPLRLWYFHNAKFDLAILAKEGLEVVGTIHCTKAIALLEYNEHASYTLEACAERIGEKKDETVETYITKNQLTEKRMGATQRYTHKFFDRVPFSIIAPYGCQDAAITHRLGLHQEAALKQLADELPPTLPSLLNCLGNERRLTRTVFRMERVGVRIDRPYCVRAARYELDRAEKAMADFKGSTGRELKNSPTLFQEVFASDKPRWGVTDLGNPSFTSESLSMFENLAAKSVLSYRDATSKANFYRGFLYHADRDDIVHPNFNPDGAGHGRFSSSNPNFQNLTAEEDDDLDQEFVVRRAIIPRPGFVFILPDYDQMEYRMMFDLACKLAGRESEIVKLMKEKGLDPHQATADAVTAMGTPLGRKRAKNGNFAFLYGSGVATLASTIGATHAEAAALKQALRRASPEVAEMIKLITRTAEVRGYVFNWFGRRCHFPDARFAYRATNYVISGGCADVNKIALNRMDEYLLTCKSRLVLTIHDENPVEVHESELAKVPQRVKELMEGVYPHQYLPLTVGMEWSGKSLADKVKGFPV